jgi:hypothetical protein
MLQCAEKIFACHSCSYFHKFENGKDNWVYSIPLAEILTRLFDTFVGVLKIFGLLALSLTASVISSTLASRSQTMFSFIIEFSYFIARHRHCCG